MPFVGSGTIQLAESVSGDPSTILRVNPLGADGTRKIYKFRLLALIRVWGLRRMID